MCFLHIRGFLVSLIITLFSVALVGGQRIPESPCPNIFQYQRTPNGGVYGTVTVPFDGSSSTLNLGINASMKGYYTDSRRVSLKIKMNTPEQDIIEQRTKTLRYLVTFPFQHTVPKITNIQLNHAEYCTGPPEELIPGQSGVTNLWAQHQYYYQAAGNGIPQNAISNPVKPNNHPAESFDRYPENVLLPTKKEPSNTIAQNNRECGVANNKIVPLILGGTDLPDGTYPWLSAMFVTKGTGYEYKCTGNLISDSHVVTAARCINYYKVQIVQTNDILFVFGKSRLQNWAVSAVTRGASNIKTHPDFDQNSGHGDISVVRLDRPLQFTSTIAPICLWSGNNDLTDLVDKIGTVAGWGADETSQKSGQFSVPVAKSVDMPVVSQEKCLYSNLTYYSLTSDMTFCAGERDGTGSCVGDYGAGFMMMKKGRYYLRGLASISLTDSSGKCDLSWFMIFCDVAKLTNWIKSAMND